MEKAKAELPDLAILDVMMPKKNGFEVFYALRSDPRTAHIRAIMLTAVSEKMGMKYRPFIFCKYPKMLSCPANIGATTMATIAIAVPNH